MPEQTVQAGLDLNAELVHPIHWATFNLAFHPWYEPMVRFTAAASRRGIGYATPVLGQVVDYGEQVPTERWWQGAMEQTISSRARSGNGSLEAGKAQQRALPG
jgi:hypothetical protein